MTTPVPEEPGRPCWWVERDVDAVETALWPWITAAGEMEIPLLGTPDWAAAEVPARLAAVAVFVLGALVERDPTVIAARLAAEIATVRLSNQLARKQAAEAIAEAIDARAVATRMLQREQIRRADQAAGAR
ncbi:hypothetical protein PSU4_27960 [Pseudonocardia sulfidoxydans NBRC 16205]|uniref:DUF2742 domain-containing protein n=1 Tax=Pseudonocardia sulfidoxydans NBRC 16205 TaxID=1223511 RepID=A0A511DGD7_9PSEU|nr:hypothetical protein [Pseudonocardia sulfidoxydans]GEL23842.1 hypothetical protein PSU4_27960 [Pseudonocardia sulfidoxydans NBRC 16205]